MAQLSLYMTEEDMADLRREAEEEGKSISSYARDIISHRHQLERSGWEKGWPPGFFDLYGSSPDFSVPEDALPKPVETW